MWTETIYVDLEHPERTPFPFKVMVADRLKGSINQKEKGKKKKLKGFLLEMRVNPCDTLGQGDHPPFEYKAYLYNHREIVQVCLVLDYSDMGHEGDLITLFFDPNEEENYTEEEENVVEAYENARNTIEERVDNQEFPVKKQYRVIFPEDVYLDKDGLEAHELYRDSNRLHMQPLPIEYALDKRREQIIQDIQENGNWADLEDDFDNVEKVTWNLPETDGGMDEKKDVYLVAVPYNVVHRFVIEIADSNKNSIKRGKAEKQADVQGMTAMMAAMGTSNKKKKGKKGNS